MSALMLVASHHGLKLFQHEYSEDVEANLFSV